MAFPSFISAGSFTNDVSGGASTTPTPPAHVANDILLVMVHNAAGATMSTTTTGWSKITQVTASGGTAAVAWFWKRATGAGTAGPTVTASSTDQFSICYVIRGCITTGTPYELEATPTNSGTDATTGVLSIATTTSGADRLVMAFSSVDGFVSGMSTDPPGWTNNSNLTPAVGTDCRMTVKSIQRASAGTEAQVTLGTTGGSSPDWGSLTLAWIPPTVAVFIPQKPFLVNQSINRASNY